jgi:hypothetical protein
VSAEPSAPRVYGNWHKPRSPGLWGFGALSLGLLMSGVVLSIVVLLKSTVAGAVCLLLTMVVVLPMRVRDRYDRDLWQRFCARVAWKVGVAKGQDLYQSGPLARIGRGTHSLPGIAASITAYDAIDGWGRPFGLLHHQGVSHVTAVIQTSADGAALLDKEEVDARVAQWGIWLAALGTEPGLLGVAVTVETSPDSGVRLRREVEGRLVEGAPPLATEIMRALINEYPAGSASITCRIALTWSMAARVEGRGQRGLEEMAVEVAHRLPQLSKTLGGTGAAPGRPMTVEEIATACRVAYDPAVHPWLEEADSEGTGITFSECGPRAHWQYDSYYRHDSGVSVSWEMAEAPRGFVTSNVLAGLLAPHPEIARKRVTLLYRMHDPAEAAQVVEKDYRDAVFNESGAKGLQVGTRLAVRQAEKTASEEAQGAGLALFGLLVTATVTDEERLDEVGVMVEDLGLGARLALRRSYGGQAAAFAAGLPLGLVLPHHLQVPQLLRELR